MMTNPTAHLTAGESLVITTDTGREVHLFLHHCDTCTSLDVWTETPGTVGPFTNTGAPERLASGLFAFRGGSRVTIDGADPTPDSVGWPAVSTAALVWHDPAEVTS